MAFIQSAEKHNKLFPKRLSEVNKPLQRRKKDEINVDCFLLLFVCLGDNGTPSNSIHITSHLMTLSYAFDLKTILKNP